MSSALLDTMLFIKVYHHWMGCLTCSGAGLSMEALRRPLWRSSFPSPSVQNRTGALCPGRGRSEVWESHSHPASLEPYIASPLHLCFYEAARAAIHVLTVVSVRIRSNQSLNGLPVFSSWNSLKGPWRLGEFGTLRARAGEVGEPTAVSRLRFSRSLLADSLEFLASLPENMADDLSPLECKCKV